MEQASLPPLRVGMLGAGTVGGGVYEILMGKSTNERVSNTSSRGIVVTKLCVQSLTKTRDFTIFDETTLTTNWRDLLTDDIDCVVEVAGGCGIAKELILAALAAHKTVVTANKAVLFEYMTEISNAVTSSSARIGYEAAVCGGIPVLNALQTAYVGDTITSVAGICNGTTNFMLTHMQNDPSVSYESVLQQAQALGYAEADPTADVDGHDVRAKMAILSQLAFGTSPTVSHGMPCTGIRAVSAGDFAACRDGLQSTIKLVGAAVRRGRTNDTLCVTVTPTVVPLSHALASIHGSGNAVSIVSHNIGTLTFAGPGAGRSPTAQSVCADVHRAALGTLPTTAFPVPRGTTNLTIVTDYTARFYVRATFHGATAPDDWSASWTVDQVLRDQDGTVALVTTACLYSTVQAACQALDAETLIMPLWEE